MKETNENLKKVQIEEKIKIRKECNEKILNLIHCIVEKEPSFRFWQILWLLFEDLSKDRFYEESYDSLETIKNKIKDIFPNIINE